MSLSEQTERVAGAGKNTLKTILQRLGVTVGSESIAQYPNLANQISNKFLPNNLLSDVTAAKYGLPPGSVPNAVFDAIAAIVKPATGKSAIVVSGKYVGNGQNDLTLNLGIYYDLLVIVRTENLSAGVARNYAVIVYNGKTENDSSALNSGFSYSPNDGIGASMISTLSEISHFMKNKASKSPVLSSGGVQPFFNFNGVTYSYVAVGSNTPRA